MKIFAPLFVLLFTVALLGQSTAQITHLDSLSKKLETATAKEKANLLNDIARYFRTSDAEKSLDYGLKALEIAIELDDKRGEANAFDNIGAGYVFLKKYDKALDCYQQSWSLFERLGDKSGSASALNNIGVVYHMQNDYDKALSYFERSLLEFGEINDRKNQAGITNNIANIYLKRAQYDDALTSYLKALSIKREVGDSVGIRSTLSNIGSIYKAINDIDKALQYYYEALAISERNNNDKEVIAILYLIGEAQLQNGKQAIALDYFDKSNAAAVKAGENEEACKALIAMADIYNKTGKTGDADRALTQSLELSKQVGNNDLKRDIFKIYYEMNLGRGNHKQALDYYRQYSELDQLLSTAKKNRMVSEAQLKYENAVVKNEELLLKMRNSEDQLDFLKAAINTTDTEKFYILMISLVVTTILLVFIGFFVFNTRRTNAEVDRLLKANASLSVENSTLLEEQRNLKKVSKTDAEFGLQAIGFGKLVADGLRNSFEKLADRVEGVVADFEVHNKDDIKTALSEIHFESNTNIKAIKDFIDWIRLKQGRINAMPQKLDVNQVFTDILADQHRQIKGKRVEVKIDFAPVKNKHVYADDKMLRQTVAYLLDDIIGKMEEGGTLHLSATLPDKMVEITMRAIIDSNVYKPTDVFDIDTYQFDSEMNRLPVNLFLCREMILKNGGDLSFSFDTNEQSVQITLKAKS